MEPRRFVALLSGGLDSAAATALALASGWEGRLALTFDYGQRARTAELRQAERLARHFRLPHRIVPLPWFENLRHGGALLGQGIIPEPDPSHLGDRTVTEATARAVWVPNRNGVFLNIAAAFAEDLGAEAVVVGFNREEAATFPDNSEAFLAATRDALRFSCGRPIDVLSPTAPLDKAGIVRTLLGTDFPWEHLWSCYRDGERMCGRCESCRRLERAIDGTEAADAIAFDMRT
jgi:7-cyano-7-deazaguanine synthase